MAVTRSVTLEPTGMTPEQAVQVLERFGITTNEDLEIVAQAVQALIGAGTLQPPPRNAMAPRAHLPVRSPAPPAFGNPASADRMPLDHAQQTARRSAARSHRTDY